MAFKINHLHLKTPDPEKTAQWYVENLGATIVSEATAAGGAASYRLNLHGVPLNVTGFVDGQKLEQHYGLEHIALDTDDLPGTVEQLKEGGARILEERSLRDGRKVCFFEGPEGVRLEVLEMRR
jgi:catechol 2,3-dioxygenase-like lactoylglutathione lyase family enzyme